MSIEQDLQRLFEDIEACAEEIANDAETYFRRFRLIPPVIGVGEGRMIYMSNKGADAVSRIAHSIRSDSHELRAAMSESDMAKLTSASIGALIVGDSDASVTEFSLPSDTAAFKSLLRQRIESKRTELYFDRTHLFGAWVFQGTTVQSVEVGPVRFWPREVWLQDAVQSGLLTKVRAARISKRWQGKRVRKRTKSDIAHIVETVGPCPWICTVDVQGHSAARSQEKALIAARIALAAIALSWQEPSASARGMGLLFDPAPPRSRTTVAYRGDQFVAYRCDNLPRLGRYVAPTDAAQFIARTVATSQTVGAALDTFLAVEPQSAKAKLETMLCNALTWFGEACREPLDFLAVVKFAAALDMLAKGKKAGGIRNLVQNRLHIIDMSASFLKDGTSAEKLVERIYNTGRSQIIHRSRPSLVADFWELRAQAELLATITLWACIRWLQSYSGPDDEDAYRMP